MWSEKVSKAKTVRKSAGGKPVSESVIPRKRAKVDQVGA